MSTLVSNTTRRTCWLSKNSDLINTVYGRRGRAKFTYLWKRRRKNERSQLHAQGDKIGSKARIIEFTLKS